jgi:serine/threonine-protein kinase
VLVVEDDADMRGLIADLLSHEGYRVEEAVTGIDALEKSRGSAPPPDVILLDLNLPMMDGWEFRVEQKRDPALARIPVVILSADAKAGAVDADHVLKKPFDANTLLDTVARALRTSRRGRAHAQNENGNGSEPHVDGLRMVRKLGGGGMGVVYEAERDEPPHRVAVKILNIELASRPELVQRFKNEARAVALLRHPNIVAAIDVGATEQGLPFLVLELLEGRTLEEEIRAGGPMRIGRAVKLARQIAAGLSAAHAQGIIHRDIKPGNIYLLKDGSVKVIDLGFAQDMHAEGGAGEEETTSGTVQYMSPEQARGQRDLDARADIYSLGATLYHMVMGELPFSGSDSLEVMAKQVMEALNASEIKNRRISKHMHYFIERMMSKDKDLRYTTPRELVEDINEQIEGFKSLEYRPEEDETSESSTVMRLVNRPGAPQEPPRTPTRRFQPPTTRKISKIDGITKRFRKR